MFVRVAQGQVVNLDTVRRFYAQGTDLIFVHSDGQTTISRYSDAASALIALSQVESSSDATGDLLRSLSILTPSTGAHGGPVSAVLTGNGFQFDLVTANFNGSVTIDVDTLTGGGGGITYISSNTLLLEWTPTNAGTFDVVYTASDGITTATLTNGFVAT